MTSYRVLFAFCTGFIAGILLRSLAPLGIASIAAALLVSAAAALVVRGRARASALLALVFVVAGGLGALRAGSAVLTGDQYLDAHIGQRVVLEGRVFQEPDVREGSVRLSVALMEASTTPVAARILAALPPQTHVRYGDTVRLSGTLAYPEAFDTEYGRTFDYPGYLAVSGIGYRLERANVAVLSPATPSLTAAAIALKQAYVGGLERSLPEPEAGLAAGITAGDKRGLGREAADEFRTANLTHIIVLSGYNITVVADALMRVLSFAPLAVRFAGGGAIALLFALMTGNAAASVRAAAMASIAMAARLGGRIYLADRALLVVVAGMAAWNPLSVAYDPGYQLSVAATAGLIWLSPLVERWCARVPERFGIRAVAVSSLSAQIAVAPLLFYSSGLVSLIALPANLLVLVVIPLAMGASAVAALGGLLVGPVAPLIALPAYALLAYIVGIVHLLASIPGAALGLPPFPGVLVFAAYAALAGLVLSVRKREAAGTRSVPAAPGFFG